MEGMEIIAIIVVIGLFIVVLKQFGIWEPLSLEGKTPGSNLKKFVCLYLEWIDFVIFKDYLLNAGTEC